MTDIELLNSPNALGEFLLRTAGGIAKQYKKTGNGYFEIDDIQMSLVNHAYEILKRKKREIEANKNIKGYLYTAMYNYAKTEVMKVFDEPKNIPIQMEGDVPAYEDTGETELIRREEALKDKEKANKFNEFLKSLCADKKVTYVQDDMPSTLHNLRQVLGIRRLAEAMGGNTTIKYLENLLKQLTGTTKSRRDLIREAMSLGYITTNDVKQYLCKTDPCYEGIDLNSIRVECCAVRKELGLRAKHKNVIYEAKRLLQENPNLTLDDFSDKLGNKCKQSSKRTYYSMFRKEFNKN